MNINFTKKPLIEHGVHKMIYNFLSTDIDLNMDCYVVESFGEEWKKFHSHTDCEIHRIGSMYFDILNEKIINKKVYAIDIGCGTGRWSKYLSDKVAFIEAVDPSDAILVADKLLKNNDNVRLIRASIESLPFDDETFDFGMSIGVLHHVPDTQKAMNDCVKKIKIGGYFYTYLYYNFENRGTLFKIIFFLVTLVRKIVSSLPERFKNLVCEALAVFVYLPVVCGGRLLRCLGLRSVSRKLPLSAYQDASFFVMRTDARDRFGTSLEKRFSRKQVLDMMRIAGLEDIEISETPPYWHAVGVRVR